METTTTTAVTLTDLSAFDPVTMALKELRQRHEGVVHDVKTTAGMAACRKDRAELKGYRLRTEEIRKKLKAPYLEAGRAVDNKAEAITKEITALESAYDRQIKAEEQRKENEKREREEAARKEREAALRAEREQAEAEAAELRRQNEELKAQIAATKAAQVQHAGNAEIAAQADAAPTGRESVDTSVESAESAPIRVADHVPAAHDAHLLDLVDTKPFDRAIAAVRKVRMPEHTNKQRVETSGLPTAQEIVDALSENEKRYTNIRHVCAVLEANRKIEGRA
ncbi:hypothetical protein [Burkholderia multivorans]|uniref:hypothetical protein n=1 Tax=Burkholderia multivorans TaxID=87883 RepID=UPI0021BFDF35|nr:hypothetical protein [Burkholderia multivorans]